ncbi:MAG: hypothetical protein ACLR3C_04695 [Eggerthella lenta]
MKAVVTGDIGCYTLGARRRCPPWTPPSTWARRFPCRMASSPAWAGTDHRPVVGVIGDSTLRTQKPVGADLHRVQPRTRNRLRAGQPHHGHDGSPGKPLQRRDAARPPLARARPEGVVRAIGVENVRTVDPNDAKAVRRALKEAVASEELSVLVFRSPCVLIDRHREPAYTR